MCYCFYAKIVLSSFRSIAQGKTYIYIPLKSTKLNQICKISIPYAVCILQVCMPLAFVSHFLSCFDYLTIVAKINWKLSLVFLYTTSEIIHITCSREVNFIGNLYGIRVMFQVLIRVQIPLHNSPPPKKTK